VSGRSAGTAEAPPLAVALLGHGKMGRLVEELAPAHGCAVVARVAGRDGGASAITAERLAGARVAIDFSVAGAVAENAERAAALGLDLVVGTTGWGEELPRVRAAVERHGVGLVHGANFSIGVQVFYGIVEAAARLLAEESGYGAWVHEIHHGGKRDAPSGTAKELLRVIERAGYGRAVDVASSRAGAVPGTHTVGFDSEADTITLQHAARSRAGFAAGALRAARWVRGKRGVYEFREIWREIIAVPRPDPPLRSG
jgi:4-hydroxy-tetrahydrodipicolinate reductase